MSHILTHPIILRKRDRFQGIWHLKTLSRHMGLERRSRMNQEFPPQSKSWSLPCIPQEVSILSGCRAAWPPRVGLSLSPHFRRAQGSHGHQLLPQQGLQGVQSLLCSSGIVSQIRAYALQLFPIPCPRGALLSSLLPSELWGQNIFCPNTMT